MVCLIPKKRPSRTPCKSATPRKKRLVTLCERKSTAAKQGPEILPGGSQSKEIRPTLVEVSPRSLTKVPVQDDESECLMDEEQVEETQKSS